MKTWFLMLCMSTTCLMFGQSEKTNTQLAKLVDSLYFADQATAQIKPPDSAAAAYQRVIRSNFAPVKQILETHGYPGYDLLGKESSNRYFLLVKHSDFDPGFQKKALKLMKKQVLKKNASGQAYAALIDRTNINAGKPQVYGTQVIMGRNTQIKPCKDLKNLDKRRQSVGLEPISEYLQKCNDVFYDMNPSEKRPEKKN